MSDASVRAALRSDAQLVAIEAPGGCGKTYQGADYAQEIAADERPLILTHTHAACSVFAERTCQARSRVEIRTVDSLISQVAGAYHAGLGLPADAAAWARRNRDGYAHIAVKVAMLLERHPMIAETLAHRYPVVICDEHQDCSGDQHAIVMAMHKQGARLRVFGDPMQRIYPEKPLPGCKTPIEWGRLAGDADAFEELDTPHRWNGHCPELGAWTLHARETLKAGGRVNLRTGRPGSVELVVAENQAQRYGDYQLAGQDRRSIDAFERAHAALLIVSRFTETAQRLRAFFHRRIPLWEGHTRPALEALVEAALAHRGEPTVLAQTLVDFMKEIGKGFSHSAFGDRFISEATEGCVRQTRGKPAALQAMARHIVNSPDHRGIANALRTLAELRNSSEDFAEVEIDRHAEFWEAVRLGGHEDLEAGFAAITHHRTYSRPKPPTKAISTIHKAKGLECGGVIILPCDAQTFPDTHEARCLLYVALSRARNRLLLVVSRRSPSPLLIL
ncbi:MAG: ATP-binding domain-containing protein [Stellaceae bacterium]